MKEHGTKCLSNHTNFNKNFPRKFRKSRRNFLKNIHRRQRRRRSLNRYYKNLRLLRTHRKYEELCSEVASFGVLDISNVMEWKQSSDNHHIPSDITEWHQKEQVAYWRSRAISLEYENRMLYKHLRDVYAQHIQDYHQYAKDSNSYMKDNTCSKHNEDYVDSNAEVSMETANSMQHCQPVNELSNEHCEFKPPSEPIGRKRRIEMEKLYGSHCPKISGVETALQLNYEHALEKLKPAYWPELQLNLG